MRLRTYQQIIRLRKIVQDKARGSANKGAYFVYVTAVCRFPQRSKQNCFAILRLRDFFDSLRAAPESAAPNLLMYLLLGSRYGASVRASAAVYADLGIDNELAVALRNSSYGALSLASAAGNAIVADMISHFSNLLH